MSGLSAVGSQEPARLVPPYDLAPNRSDLRPQRWRRAGLQLRAASWRSKQMNGTRRSPPVAHGRVCLERPLHTSSCWSRAGRTRRPICGLPSTTISTASDQSRGVCRSWPSTAISRLSSSRNRAASRCSSVAQPGNGSPEGMQPDSAESRRRFTAACRAVSRSISIVELTVEA